MGNVVFSLNFKSVTCLYKFNIADQHLESEGFLWKKQWWELCY